MLAPYVAANYQCVAGVGEASYFGDAIDTATGEPLPEPTPAWKLGPASAIAFELQRRQLHGDEYVAGEVSSPGRRRGSPTPSCSSSAGGSAPTSPVLARGPGQPAPLRTVHLGGGAGDSTSDPPSPMARAYSPLSPMALPAPYVTSGSQAHGTAAPSLLRKSWHAGDKAPGA